MADFITGSLTATDTICRGTTSTASQLVMDTVGYSGAGFTIAAGGSVSFWASSDIGVTWSPLGMTTSDGLTRATTASAAGLWRGNVSGYTHVGIVATAITGGSISTKIFCSPASNDGSGSGGGGGSGMVPAGSTGITTFSTTGTSGAATYSPSTGALNIPNSVPNGYTFNCQQFVPTAYSTTSTVSVSTGQGVAFTPQTSQLLVTLNVNTSNNPGFVAIFRNPTAIPVAGAGVGTDPVVIFLGNTIINTSQYFAAAVYDTGLTPGLTYYYYLTLRSNSATAINLVAGSGKVQVSEFHL